MSRSNRAGTVAETPRWAAPRLRDVPRVGSRVTDEVAAQMVAAGVDVLDLHAYPRRRLPAHVLRAAAAAAEQNGVAPTRGLEVLRAAIADTLSRELRRPVDPDTEVLVTAGGMQALDVALAALLDTGEEAIASVPVFFLDWFFQRQSAQLIGVPTRAADGYAVDWSAFERAITPSTRLIVAITPANPTGYVLSAGDLDALADIADRHNLMVISDESYDRFVYDGGQHLSPAAHPALARRTLVIRSFTKSFAMAGWRVGYMMGPAPTIAACLNVLEWTALYGSVVPQAAAAAAMAGPQDWLGDVAAEFQQRRDDLLMALHSLDVPVVRPRGGPFLFPDVSQLGRGSGAAAWLLREWGVPAVDGALLRGAGHVRLAFGADDETFDKLTGRLRMAFGARAPQ